MMNKTVVYIPLDERFCNFGYPYELGRIAGLDVARPPVELMSRMKAPGDVDGLWKWLYEHIKGASYAVLSLDTLVYGGLLYSRIHDLPEKECISRLERIRKLKELNPSIEIHAFELIMRTASYDSSNEEPDYWEHCGFKIYKYGWLTDKKKRTGLSADEEKTLKEISASVPKAHLKDYTVRREKNMQVNLSALKLVEEKVIDHLVIPKDDNAEYGYSTKDQDIVNAEIRGRRLQDRVFVYPGTDEAGCTLMGRVLAKIHKYTPKVFVSYSSTLGPTIIAWGEDRPIHESIKAQVVSAGGFLVEDYRDADFILMANTPGKHMRNCDQQNDGDYTFVCFRNLTDFVRRLKYFLSRGKKCIVADIAYCNGADNELMDHLVREKLLDKISAYGGWNTAANTLGVVIMQGIIATIPKLRRLAKSAEYRKFHLHKIIEDWAYMANVREEFAGDPKKIGYDPYKLGRDRARISREILVKLNEFVARRLVPSVAVKEIKILSVKQAWDRIFDVEFEFQVR